MTPKILKSSLEGVTPENFALVVAKHASDLREYDAHMKRVKESEAEKREPDHPGFHQAYPPPQTLRIVDDAVRRPDFVPDYEIIDDLPSPLRVSKDKTLALIADAEKEIVNDILPAAKVRITGIRAADGDEDAKATIASLMAVGRRAAELASDVEDWTKPGDLTLDDIKRRLLP